MSSGSSFSSGIIKAPSFILNVSTDNIYEFMKTNEFDNLIADTSIKTLEMQFQPPQPDQDVKDYFYIYNVTDAFITSRPWWSILREPRSYDNNNYRVLLERLPEKVEKSYRLIASKQYPADCSQHKLHVVHITGYDAYGNKISDERSGGSYAWSHDMIFMIIAAKHAKFLDPGYCKLYNLNLCAHLPMTNCSVPEAFHNLTHFHVVDVNTYFDKATLDGKYIDKTVTIAFNDSMIHLGMFQYTAKVYYYTVRGFNESSPVFMSSHGGNLFYDFISTGINHRYNSVFRNLIDEKIHEMRVTSKVFFPATEQCVAIHIRHHDRHIAGETNIIEWCDKFVHFPNGTCADRYGQVMGCVKYKNYGCSSNPFGYMSFKDYIHAASLVLPHVKNIFIMTDDGPWVEHHKPSVEDKYNIYTIHGSNMHSADSVANGVTFFASIEAARQCSGFVGHSGSAVYGLMMQYMCTRHGPEGRRKYGQCPPAFNFGMTHHEGYDQPYLPPMEEDS